MKLPGFFIVGGPRCGTTALSTYLGGHAEICFAIPKEPHYFIACSEPENLDYLKRHYLQRFFSHCRPEHRILGEGSVSYLYFPEAIAGILKVNPAAKFIVSVRNPLDMIPSYHARVVYTTDEPCMDLDTAWSLQDARAHGEQVPACCRVPELLQYAKIGMHGQNLQRLYDTAGRARVHVVVFDDLMADATAVYRDILQFIGVPDDGRKVSGAARANRRFRSQRLQRLLKQPPGFRKGTFTKRAGGMPRVKLPGVLDRFRRWLLRLNEAECSRSPLSAFMQQALLETFGDDVVLLGKLLDRDLGHWLAGAVAERTADSQPNAS